MEKMRLENEIKKIAYLTNQLFDIKTLEPTFGGGEKYCMYLGALLKDRGFNVTFFQEAQQEFKKDYYEFSVIGLKKKTNTDQRGGEGSICDRFYHLSKEYDRVIYNQPYLASRKTRNDALMICHGIWFDYYGLSISNQNEKGILELYNIFRNPGSIISVDTNSINVVRSLWPEFVEKMKYIPNWVDRNIFHPPPVPRNNERITVLFPRRADIFRGSRLLSDILRNTAHDCRFLWVGGGDETEISLIKKISYRDSRLEYYDASFNEMAQFYSTADICVIPTVAAEGTSLSCLEGLASGCALIATNVGGLPDLIQPDVNGLLVDSNAESIASAINFLIKDKDERERLQKAGPIFAERFSLEAWKSRYEEFFLSRGWFS